MNQRLEQFVHDHREDFDTEEPSKKVWDNIRLDMEPPKAKRSIVLHLTRTSLSVAAAILLVVAVGFWYLGTRHSSTTGTQDPRITSADKGVRSPAGENPTGAEKSLAETQGQSPADTP
ncbi:MAG TPA: hypothetical protein VGM31_00745, partial [Puia sp.]